MKRFLHLIVAIICLYFSVWGQEAVTAFNADVVGPRPATAQMRRFESPQPSLATGAVRFPVDIFSVNADGVVLPLRLCYSTQGVKADSCHL